VSAVCLRWPSPATGQRPRRCCQRPAERPCVDGTLIRISPRTSQGGLKAWPAELERERYELTTVLVMWNMIESLPEGIAHLTPDLEVLDVSYNKIRSLHDSFGMLAHLHELMIDGNMLSEVPSAAARLPLTMLSLAKNKIKKLPEFPLKTLRILDLGHNLMAGELPGHFLQGCPLLEELYLEDNMLTSLPTELSSLTRLRILVVSDNRLSGLPHDIEACANLECLLLRNNMVTFFPATLWTLSRLKILDASHNALIGLSDDMGGLGSLESFSVSNNRLREIPPTISFCRKLKELDVSHNVLTHLPTSLWDCLELHAADARGNPELPYPSTTLCDADLLRAMARDGGPSRMPNLDGQIPELGTEALQRMKSTVKLATSKNLTTQEELRNQGGSDSEDDGGRFLPHTRLAGMIAAGVQHIQKTQEPQQAAAKDVRGMQKVMTGMGIRTRDRDDTRGEDMRANMRAKRVEAGSGDDGAQAADHNYVASTSDALDPGTVDFRSWRQQSEALRRSLHRGGAGAAWAGKGTGGHWQRKEASPAARPRHGGIGLPSIDVRRGGVPGAAGVRDDSYMLTGSPATLSPLLVRQMRTKMGAAPPRGGPVASTSGQGAATSGHSAVARPKISPWRHAKVPRREQKLGAPTRGGWAPMARGANEAAYRAPTVKQRALEQMSVDLEHDGPAGRADAYGCIGVEQRDVSASATKIIIGTSAEFGVASASTRAQDVRRESMLQGGGHVA